MPKRTATDSALLLLRKTEVRQRLVDEMRGDVLELGMGSGPTLPFVVQRSGVITSYTGVDLDARNVANARAHLAEFTPSFPVTLREGNAESLPMFADGSFDTVATSLMLCSVDDPHRALQEMLRVCRPGGRLVLLEHVVHPNPTLAAIMRAITPAWSKLAGNCHLDRETHRWVRELGVEIESDHTAVGGTFHQIVARVPISS